MGREYKCLTLEQIQHFLKHGYVVIKSAFTKEQTVEWTRNIWVRLGLDPNNAETWDRERIHMPSHKRIPVADFAPKAWDAIQDLLGGADRIDANTSTWGDSFIINLGTSALAASCEEIAPQDLDNWHVDGDFFVHYLDSPEQALLVIPIFSEIKPRGGGTMISPDGLDLIAQYLAAHPEGVLPIGQSFTPSTTVCDDPKSDPGYWSHSVAIKRCKQFVELTGDVGDVVLMHPLMMHSASKNYLRIPRIITNPPVALTHPFQFNRLNPEDYSLVELKTLKALGVDALDFQITTERRKLVPERVAVQAKMLEEEKQRVMSAAG
ncbi:hypothetical protein AMATHDRAFT_76302 [Amanita thiersii Skay4041]|uniref:Phytanoyl-CoA dioxygenase n=1 Tax=Amanita thiersii Skay4041 TaxID=703135 RepID=A0A2A9NLQ9_9AGAR|nr:hypothetical protein AMATHDRAFT_76302 [Amanita thiersii Skay4041]